MGNVAIATRMRLAWQAQSNKTTQMVLMNSDINLLDGEDVRFIIQAIDLDIEENAGEKRESLRFIRVQFWVVCLVTGWVMLGGGLVIWVVLCCRKNRSAAVCGIEF